jgi:hypothetical protein
LSLQGVRDRDVGGRKRWEVARRAPEHIAGESDTFAESRGSSFDLGICDRLDRLDVAADSFAFTVANAKG